LFEEISIWAADARNERATKRPSLIRQLRDSIAEESLLESRLLLCADVTS
jgi:hypothetical protein